VDAYEKVGKTHKYDSSQRSSKPKQESKKASRLLTAASVATTMVAKCCKQGCLDDDAWFLRIRQARRDFYAIEGEKARSQELLFLLSALYDKRAEVFRYEVLGEPVCAAAWALVYGVSSSKLDPIRLVVRKGGRFLGGAAPRRRTAPQALAAFEFLVSSLLSPLF
jgi:hypothetical protein